MYWLNISHSFKHHSKAGFGNIQKCQTTRYCLAYNPMMAESFKTKTMVELKHMLKEQGLPITGVKQDLVARLVHAQGKTVVELKYMLKEQGLPITGVKQDLVARLGIGKGGLSDKKKIKVMPAKSNVIPTKSIAVHLKSKAVLPKSMAVLPKSVAIIPKSMAVLPMSMAVPGYGLFKCDQWAVPSESKAVPIMGKAIPPKSKVSSEQRLCKNCKSLPCKNGEDVPSTGVLMVGIKVGMCGGGGKILQISNHSVLINRKQHYPGGKTFTKQYIVEEVGTDPYYSPITFDCGPARKKTKYTMT